MISFSNIFKIQHKIMEHAYGLISVMAVSIWNVFNRPCATVQLDIIGMAIHAVKISINLSFIAINFLF